MTAVPPLSLETYRLTAGDVPTWLGSSLIVGIIDAVFLYTFFYSPDQLTPINVLVVLTLFSVLPFVSSRITTSLKGWWITSVGQWFRLMVVVTFYPLFFIVGYAINISVFALIPGLFMAHCILYHFIRIGTFYSYRKRCTVVNKYVDMAHRLYVTLPMHLRS